MSHEQTGSWAVRRLVDEKRPTRVVEELHQVAATTTERRLRAHVDCWTLGRFPVLFSLSSAIDNSVGATNLPVRKPSLIDHCSRMDAFRLSWTIAQPRTAGRTVRCDLLAGTYPPDEVALQLHLDSMIPSHVRRPM